MVGSIAWLSHQKCDDMFLFHKWNGTKTYGFGRNTRDFGTDYGICCWYTPQLNFSAIPDGPDTDWVSLLKGCFTYGKKIDTLVYVYWARHGLQDDRKYLASYVFCCA